MRTPTPQLDGLSIFCQRMRKQGNSLQDIAYEIDKDHSTVIYHLKRFENLMSVDKKFQKAEKDFRIEDFKEQYKASRKAKEKAQKERIYYAEFNTSGKPEKRK